MIIIAFVNYIGTWRSKFNLMLHDLQLQIHIPKMLLDFLCILCALFVSSYSAFFFVGMVIVCKTHHIYRQRMHSQICRVKKEMSTFEAHRKLNTKAWQRWGKVNWTKVGKKFHSSAKTSENSFSVNIDLKPCSWLTWKIVFWV